LIILYTSSGHTDSLLVGYFHLTPSVSNCSSCCIHVFSGVLEIFFNTFNILILKLHAITASEHTNKHTVSILHSLKKRNLLLIDCLNWTNYWLLPNETTWLWWLMTASAIKSQWSNSLLFNYNGRLRIPLSLSLSRHTDNLLVNQSWCWINDLSCHRGKKFFFSLRWWW
jgi:hypothetical protein